MIHKLPSEAFEILDLISLNKKMTQEEISNAIDADKKSIKYAIRRLQENEVIKQIPDLMDMRVVHYRLPTPDELPAIQDRVSETLMSKLEDYLTLEFHIPENHTTMSADY